MALNKTLTFDLELKPGGIPPIIHASQGDIGRTFKANIYWDGSAATAYLTNATVVLRGRKPDKTVFEYTATLAGSMVTFETTEQMTIIGGPVECELVFSQGGDVIASANFVLIVEESPWNPDALSESEVTDLAELVEQTIGGDVRDEVDALIEANPELMLQDNAVTTPKIAAGAVTEGKIASNAVTTGKLATGAVTSAKVDADFLKTIENTYVTPEMFGAVGDGTTDDTAALRAAINNGSIVIGTKLYKTTEPITITGSNRVIDFSKSNITYTGTDSAFFITGCRDSDMYFGFIDATNGGCVRFGGSVRADYSQYVNIYFHSMKAAVGKNCIEAEPDNTWVNEIRVFKGKFERGANAIYLNSKRTNSETMATGWTFQNVGFEGVTNGAYIKSDTDWSQGYTFIGCRYAETQATLITTSGYVERLLFVGANMLKEAHLSLSTNTTRALFITPYKTSDNRYFPACEYNLGVFRYPLNNYSTTLEASTNLDTIIADGEYYAPSAVTNYPPRCSPYGRLTVRKVGTMTCQQWQNSTGTNSRYSKAYRTSNNDGATWTAWFYDVSQTSSDNITTDLDTVLKPGTYRVAGASNRPARCNDGGTLLVFAANVNIVQEYTANVKNDSQYWKAFRSSNNSGTSWNEWKYITV